MPSLTFDDLIANGTLFAEIAGTLRAAANARRSELLVQLRSLGDWRAPTRRVVAHVHEGGPTLCVLHRWDEATDRFRSV